MTPLPSSIEGLMGLWEGHLVSLSSKGLELGNESPLSSSGGLSGYPDCPPNERCNPESMVGTMNPLEGNPRPSRAGRSQDKITAHSMAFLVLLAKGHRDFSDFRPTDEGVMYTSYVETTCNGLTLPSVNADGEVIRSLAKKMWKKIVNDSVDFDEEELKLMEKVGIKI